MAERESTLTKFIPTVSATASAAEIVRSFSHWRDVAGKQPVFITNHGRETHVLLDIDDYHGLRAEESSGPAGARSDSEDLVGLAKWIEDALLVCDRELRVEYVNRVASAVCRTAASDLIGRSLLEALPAITGTLMEVHTRRTVLSGQPSAADIPSPFSDGAWLHFQSFPLGSRNILMFRDITEDVQRHRLADVKAAMLEAMTVHGGVGYVRLSVRGTI